jgi:hypothetical protein
MSHRFPTTNGTLAREAMQYTRHQPEKTLLYQVIEEHYPEFLYHLSESDKTLPQYVQTEFEAYLKCGRLESSQTLAKEGGFSLHAGVSAKAHQRDKVGRLCRYIARPAVSTHRLERLPDGSLSYELKTPYKNGTTHVVFEPLDFIARLAALVPKPRFHLTRFHGVFAPNSKHRAMVTGDGKEKQPLLTIIEPPADCEGCRGKMSWAMRLKRVFNIDVTVCRHCQGTMRIIACIVR